MKLVIGSNYLKVGKVTKSREVKELNKKLKDLQKLSDHMKVKLQKSQQPYKIIMKN